MNFVHEYLISVTHRHPTLGILAGFSGLGASVLSVLKIISIVAGSLGAIFGLIAAFYTMLNQYRIFKSRK